MNLEQNSREPNTRTRRLSLPFVVPTIARKYGAVKLRDFEVDRLLMEQHCLSNGDTGLQLSPSHGAYLPSERS